MTKMSKKRTPAKFVQVETTYVGALGQAIITALDADGFVWRYVFSGSGSKWVRMSAAREDRSFVHEPQARIEMPNRGTRGNLKPRQRK